jgi:hypothetical protein
MQGVMARRHWYVGLQENSKASAISNQSFNIRFAAKHIVLVMWENPGGCSEKPVYLEYFYSIQFNPSKSNNINITNNNK